MHTAVQKSYERCGFQLKCLLVTMSGIAVSLSTVGIVFAAAPANNSSSQEMVFVGQDVTQQDHYSWTFRRPLSGGGQQSVSMMAPTGSLFEFHETTLSNAVRKHELYVPVQGDAVQQIQEMQDLRGILLKAEGITQLPKIHPFAVPNNTSGTTSTTIGTTNPTATAASGSLSAEGNFLCGSYNVYDDFTVYYNDEPTNNVEPTSCNEHLSADPSSGILTEDGFYCNGTVWDNTAALTTGTNYNTFTNLPPSYSDVIAPSPAELIVYAKGSNGQYYSGAVELLNEAPA